MFAGQFSDISHRKSVDILVWPQKGGKTVWILGKQQYVGNVVPFCEVETLVSSELSGCTRSRDPFLRVWNTLFFAAAQENSWLGYRLGHLSGVHPPFTGGISPMNSGVLDPSTSGGTRPNGSG